MKATYLYNGLQGLPRFQAIVSCALKQLRKVYKLHYQIAIGLAKVKP
jgi:hypothetical protein